MRRFPFIFITRRLLLRACVLVSLAWGPHLPAQTGIRFQRFVLSSGISDLTINDIAQDSTGYLWFATRNGLNRYDGERFKVFSTRGDDTTSLTHDNVQKVFVDSRGTLWVGTTRGLCRYDPLQQNFRRYKMSDDERKEAEDINGIVEDPSGMLWLGVAGTGIVRLDPGSGGLTRYAYERDNAHTISSNSIRCILMDRDGFVWAGTIGHGLNRLDPRTGMVERFRHDSADPSSVGGGRIEALRLDPEGNVWVATQYGGLNMVRPGRRGFIRFVHEPRNPGSISANWASAVLFDRSGIMWIGTQGGGVNLADHRRMHFQSFVHNTFDPFSISDDYSQCIFQDRSGVIWVGTGSGLNKVLRYSTVFRHMSDRPGERPILGSLSVHAVIKDRTGDTWVGTRTGLTRITAARARVFHYLQDLRFPDGSPASDIGAILEDRQGTLWMGTGGMGLYQMTDPGSAPGRFRRWTHTFHDSSTLSDNHVSALYEDIAGTLWVGTDGGGLNSFDRITGRFTRHRHDPQDPGDNSIMCITENRARNLCVGTMRGLHILDHANGTCTRYLHDEAAPDGLPSNAVFGIAEDHAGKLWIVTARGLSIFNPATGHFRNYFTLDGLPDVFLKGIVMDASGTMWISSRSGLTHAVEDSTGAIRFRNYGVADGLPVIDFNPTVFSRGSDGELLFGTGNGVVRFFPEELKVRRDAPPIAITSFKVFDVERPLLSHLELSHREYHVTVEFAALDFTAPEQHQFEYRLEGLDRDWIPAKATRAAQYANLSPGTYIFRVRGAHGDGVWNMTGASFSFTILPPYWGTWWFRLLVVAVLAAILTLLYTYRVRHLLAVERLRTRIASDLHDDVGSALTRIAIHSEVIQTTENPDKIAASSRMIGTMSREIVGTLSDIVWSIDARHDAFQDLAGRVRTFALEVLGARDVSVHFTTDGLDLSRKVNAEVRQNLYLICKEAINNIARHSRATDVWITITDSNGRRRVSIEDNGTGFVAEESHAGHGLKNMRMRAARIGGTIAFEKGRGVKIVVEV